MTAPTGLLALSEEELVAYALREHGGSWATREYSSTLTTQNGYHVVLGGSLDGVRKVYRVEPEALVRVDRP